MREDTRPLDDIVSTACQAEGSVTGAAEILGISKQAVSKRLRGVRVLHEIWLRQNGNGKTAEVFEKEYREGFGEHVAKAIAREARRWEKAREQLSMAEERQEGYRARLEAAEAEEKRLMQEAAETGDVDGAAKQIAEARALRDTMREVIRTGGIVIGEIRTELDKAAKALESAARRAVLAWRMDATRGLVERLEAVWEMNRAFERVVTSGLNAMKNDRGLPVSASVLGIHESGLLVGDEVETAIRDLKRRLDAPAEMERRAQAAEREKEEFQKGGRGPANVTGELVDRKLGG